MEMPRRQTEQRVFLHCGWNVLNVLNVQFWWRYSVILIMCIFWATAYLALRKSFQPRATPCWLHSARKKNWISQSQLMMPKNGRASFQSSARCKLHLCFCIVLVTAICNADVWEAATKLHAWNMHTVSSQSLSTSGFSLLPQSGTKEFYVPQSHCYEATVREPLLSN